MATPIVNDISPRIQFVSLPDQTVFVYPFVIFEGSDLTVFKTPVGIPASAADKLEFIVDYNVTGIGADEGGTVVLNVGANGGDIITIARTSPIERVTNFKPGDFSVEEMNDALNSQVTFSQDNEMVGEKLTPNYEPSAIVESGQLLLPQLGDGEFWIGSPDGKGLIKAQLDQAPDCADLRADLAVNAGPIVAGANLVGFFDFAGGGPGPTNVQLALEEVIEEVIEIQTAQDKRDKNILLGGDFGTNPFQEGTVFSDTQIGSKRYIADGWEIGIVGAMRVSTDSDINNPVPIVLSDIYSDLSLKIVNEVPQATIAANERAILSQPMEGYYFREIAQRISFLSFYVRSSVTGTYCVALVSNGGDTSWVEEYVINTPNVWRRVIIEIPPSPAAGLWGDYRESRAVSLNFTLAAGVDSQQTAGSWQAIGNKIATANQVNFFDSPVGANFNINLIKLEPIQVTPFQTISQEEEIAWAQRYFEKSYNIFQFPGVVSNAGMTSFYQPFNVPFMRSFIRTFKSEKRVTPAITWFSPATGAANKIHRFSPAAADFDVVQQADESTSDTGFPDVFTVLAGELVGAHFTANARMNL